MNNLEKLVQENREEFDAVEPLNGHLERFQERLGIKDQPEIRIPSRFSLLKVAAIILIIITGSIMVFDLTTRSIRERFSFGDANTELPAELSEAIQYYDAKVSAQMKEVRKLASNPVEAGIINEAAIKEMQTLDENTRDLQKSFAENPNSERLQAAIIQNQQMKEGIMNKIVNQLNKH